MPVEEPNVAIESIRRRVAGIRDIAADDEKAHSLEIELHHDVLHAISLGCANPDLLAREALRTRSIPFCRWTA